MLKKASHIYVVLAVEILGKQEGVVTLKGRREWRVVSSEYAISNTHY